MWQELCSCHIIYYICMTAPGRSGDSSIKQRKPGMLRYLMAGHAPFGVTFGRWITKGAGRSNHISRSSHHITGAVFFIFVE